jgi:Ca2+-binding RTX toxin-like protein
MFGGTGDDVLTGGGGADRLFGQGGQDTLSGGAGFDRLWGGAGADCFVYRAGFANDWIFDFSVSEGDRLQIYSDAATEGDLAQIAAIEDDDTYLTFETGTLRLIGNTDWAALAGQIDWL